MYKTQRDSGYSHRLWNLKGNTGRQPATESLLVAPTTSRRHNFIK